jgi:predicted transcriptional regulator
MTDAETFSWILLSVDERGSTRRQISELADGINHAVPTHREMETSLRWLLQRGLIREDDSGFALTDAGRALIARFRSPTRPIMQTWEAVSEAVQELLPP